MFQKLLIAARGEIVLRIARTCERLGIATVAIHGETEASAAHVAICDETVCVGGPAARDSYLNTAAIIAAAKQTGANAIHPGCGALSQSAAFARAVSDAGLALVGAPPEVLARFSDPAESRELARLAGVRALPFVPLPANGVQAAHEQARELGYPLLVRASADESIVERVDDPEELTQAIGQCRDRASASCEDARIHMEPLPDRPRLLTAMVMADSRSDTIALGDIERCVERQLGARILLEESPAPALVGLPDGTLKRQILWDAACRVAREGGLTGAASVEFCLDTAARLAFVRLRPGLPLEHALADMCAGIDAVEAQIRVAAGEPLPQDVRRAQPSGHAIQARVFAAPGDAEASSAPRELQTLRWPMLAPGTLRVETDLTVGALPGTDYDPLVARVVAYGQTRHQAVLTLDRALAETTIEPLSTNIAELRQILGDESFRAGQYDAEFAERLSAQLRDSP
jgi:acetyl-CoA carboxylase biotin carboxylase subunit/3-methylcrotonyl-CoA carboxylase alpha subunit